MKKYESATIEIVTVSFLDIITISNHGDYNGNEGDPLPDGIITLNPWASE